MLWCCWTEMEDHGRMEARVLQVLERMQTALVTISSTRVDDRIFLTCIVETDEDHAARIEPVLRKIDGMVSVKVLPEASTTHRMLALLRVLCDVTERAEVLQFIGALNARAIMVRPLWVAFEVVGTAQEIEGIYQSARAYGMVDLVSSACAFMTAADGERRSPATSPCEDELRPTPEHDD